jgi:hypothetical protein
MLPSSSSLSCRNSCYLKTVHYGDRRMHIHRCVRTRQQQSYAPSAYRAWIASRNSFAQAKPAAANRSQRISGSSSALHSNRLSNRLITSEVSSGSIRESPCSAWHLLCSPSFSSDLLYVITADSAIIRWDIGKWNNVTSWRVKQQK